MKVQYSGKFGSDLYLKFIWEQSDKQEYTTFERKHVEKNRDNCVYRLPKNITLETLHPDRLALAIILSIYSFIGKRLVLPFEVSEEFSNIVAAQLNINLSYDPSLPIYNPALVETSSLPAFSTAVVTESNAVSSDDPLQTDETEIDQEMIAILESAVEEASATPLDQDSAEIIGKESVPIPVPEPEELFGFENTAALPPPAPETEIFIDANNLPEIFHDGSVKPAAHQFNLQTASQLRPVLSLSMGVDSVCGMAIMPPETVGVFLDRIFPPTGEMFYNKDHAYSSLYKMKKKHKREIYIVKTDMEYLRKRVGFVIDIGVGVPAILLSNALNFRSIGYGYSVHHMKHYGDGTHLTMNCTGDYCQFNHSQWNEVFKTAGLFLNFITCGLSEIGTQTIVARSPFNNLASGCMRGTIERPCLKCPKCYRKLILEDLVKYGRIDDPRGHYQILSQSDEHSLDKIFAEFASGLIMAYSYGLRAYTGADLFLKRVQQKLHAENNCNWKNNLKYVTKWFNGANDRVDPLCLPYLMDALARYGIQTI